ncbi:MAG: glycosyl transferase, partial [Methylobacterium sp.]|nr:glycosyl transferase [Methylobacterium sp.]
RIAPEDAARVAAHPLAGHAVAAAERASPRLVHRPLGPKQLPGQIRLATAVLPLVRLVTRLRDAARLSQRSARER